MTNQAQLGHSARAVLHRLGGAGPALLLIHGFGADRYGWAATAPALFDVATVWAVDLPAHGAADHAVGAGDVASLAGAVAPHLAEIGGPAVVVGHSLGGAVALNLAHMVPQYLRHLVLLSPAGLGGGLDHGYLHAFAQLQSPDQTRDWLHRLVAQKRFIAPAMAAHVLTSLQDPARRAALAQIAAQLEQAPPPAVPRHLPVDMIWGQADQINPPPQDSADHAAHARITQLPDIGHLPQIEAASRVNALIRAAVLQS